MDSCCRLGEEYQSGKHVLYESNNFFITPTIGQMGIEGYVLLCSKEHYTGIGNLPPQHEHELERVLEKTRSVISDTYSSPVLVFEHGPRIGCHKGGGCLDHAHLHVVPTTVDVMGFLTALFKPEEIGGFGRLHELYAAEKSSYLFVETDERKRYVVEVEFPLPSQYLRQVIASQLGRPNWDWRLDPDMTTFEETMERLQGRF